MKPGKLTGHVLFERYSDVVSLCSPLALLGIHGFIFVRHFPDGSFVDLSNQLHWSEAFLKSYFEEKYLNIDIQDHMFVSNGISLWSHNPDNIIWREGKEFGFRSGISIYSKESGYSDLFCFYSTNAPSQMDPQFLRNLDSLKKFTGYFQTQSKKIILEGIASPLLSPQKYWQGKIENPLGDISNAFLNSIHSHLDPGKKLNLTTREFECIRWVSEGKTAGETGTILGISKRTVETHLANAKDKLGVIRTPQLISLVQSTTHA